MGFLLVWRGVYLRRIPFRRPAISDLRAASTYKPRC